MATKVRRFVIVVTETFKPWQITNVNTAYNKKQTYSNNRGTRLYLVS